MATSARAGAAARGAGGDQRLHRRRLSRAAPPGGADRQLRRRHRAAGAPIARARCCRAGRVMSDTWNLLHYFRLSDDGRMVFGGRASFTPTRVRAQRRGFWPAAMRRVFPQLRDGPDRVSPGRARSPSPRPDAARRTARRDPLRAGLRRPRRGARHLARRPDGRRARGPRGRSRSSPAGACPAIPLYGGTPWFLPVVGGVLPDEGLAELTRSARLQEPRLKGEPT